MRLSLRRCGTLYQGFWYCGSTLAKASPTISLSFTILSLCSFDVSKSDKKRNWNLRQCSREGSFGEADCRSQEITRAIYIHLTLPERFRGCPALLPEIDFDHALLHPCFATTPHGAISLHLRVGKRGVMTVVWEIHGMETKLWVHAVIQPSDPARSFVFRIIVRATRQSWQCAEFGRETRAGDGWQGLHMIVDFSAFAPYDGRWGPLPSIVFLRSDFSVPRHGHVSTPRGVGTPV